MKEVAKAHEKRSLGDFETALKTWKDGQSRLLFPPARLPC